MREREREIEKERERERETTRELTATEVFRPFRPKVVLTSSRDAFLGAK